MERKFNEFPNPLFDDYDHFTSDFEYEPEPLPWDYHFDWQLGCDFNIDTSGIPSGKLEKFMTGTNTYMHYDRKQKWGMCPYERRRFAHWHGFKVEMNNIDRIVASMVKPCAMVDEIVKRIKANPKYKHYATYRNAAGYMIRDLQNPDYWWWNSNKRLRKFVVVNNCVWLKTETRKYLGEWHG
jgi:hypothetical protein